MGQLLSLHPPSRTGIIHLCDDSLIASGILANFLAVVDFTDLPENGELAAVIVCGELLVRYIWQTNKGCYHLCADNPEYPALCLEKSEIIILGRIIETFPARASAREQMTS